MADNVLNLSAFGEIIEPTGKRKYSSDKVQPEPEEGGEIIKLEPISPKKEIPASVETTEGGSKANKVAAKALQNMAQAKLLHWQTHSYAEHKALDKFFDSFIDISDTLVEAIMGKYGRPVFSEEETNLKLTNYESPENPDGLPRFIEHLDACYRQECVAEFSEEKDPEIFNIIQEILSLIDKTKYLLSLK